MTEMTVTERDKHILKGWLRVTKKSLGEPGNDDEYTRDLIRLLEMASAYITLKAECDKVVKGDEYGWLIETGPTHAPLYLSRHEFYKEEERLFNNVFIWQLDPFKALRFAREKDARDFFKIAKDKELTFACEKELRFCEHAFEHALKKEQG